GAFQDAPRPREAFLGKVGRGQAVGRRLGSVQLLGIGRIAQEFPQAGGLRAGRAQGVQHLFGIQAQQPGHRDGRRQRAHRAGGVEDLVVRAPQEFAYAYAHFVARHRSHEQVLARAAQRLGYRQRGWKHHGGRVEHRTVVHVVLFHHVCRRGVDHGGEQWRGLPPSDQYLRWSVGWTHGRRIALDGLHRPRARARQYRTQAVKQQVFGSPQYGGRDIVKAQVGGEFRERGAGVGVMVGHSHQNERGRPSTCSATYARIRLVEIGATWYRRVSRNLRSTSYSLAKPKPPWNCRQALAASHDASAASSLAMFAWAPHGWGASNRRQAS